MSPPLCLAGRGERGPPGRHEAAPCEQKRGNLVKWDCRLGAPAPEASPTLRGAADFPTHPFDVGGPKRPGQKCELALGRLGICDIRQQCRNQRRRYRPAVLTTTPIILMKKKSLHSICFKRFTIKTNTAISGTLSV